MRLFDICLIDSIIDSIYSYFLSLFIYILINYFFLIVFKFISRLYYFNEYLHVKIIYQVYTHSSILLFYLFCCQTKHI